jgi:DeoR/GlpR family transcriptional regulator of sugar metabolism
MKSIIPAQRRQLILEAIVEADSVKTRELAFRLRVSEMTVRRDIDELDRDHLIRKTRGGATSHITASRSRDVFSTDDILDETVAMAAAGLVKNSMIVGVQGGRDTGALIRALERVDDLTIITNSLGASEQEGRFEHRPTSPHLLLTPGVRQGPDALVGPLTVSMLKTIRTDIAFIDVAGPRDGIGFTSTSLEQAQIVETFAANTHYSVVLADERHWAQFGQYRVPNFSRADMVVRSKSQSQYPHYEWNNFASSVVEV